MPWVKKQADPEYLAHNQDVEKLFNSVDRPRLIGDAARIAGLGRQQFEAFGIITSLPGTGGDIKPGPQRDYVLKDMRTREVSNPNALLASNATAVVKVRANVLPGVQAGDRVDVIVQRSNDCDSTNLRNGYLMNTRLLELVSISGVIRQSDLKAEAAGHLISLPPSLNSTKKIDPDLAIVLGGAKVLEDQNALLQLNEKTRHFKSVKEATKAINDRFDIVYKGERRGVAEGKSDRTIELLVPGIYRLDIAHYTDTVMSIGFMDRGTDKADRLKSAETLLNASVTARRGALQLEAIGAEGIPALQRALKSSEQEVRFYAAYSLAYLNDESATTPLLELARTENAFRHFALIGLSAMDHPKSHEALVSLLQEAEPELCYGALRMLRRSTPLDQLTAGRQLEHIGRVTELSSPNKMIAVSLEDEAEIAIFGGQIPIKLDRIYEPSSRMMMRVENNGMIRVSNFRVSGEDSVAMAESNLASVLEAFNAVGANYSDVIMFLDAAKQNRWIIEPIAFNPMPRGGRSFDREANTSASLEVTKREDIPQDAATIPKYSWYDYRKYDPR